MLDKFFHKTLRIPYSLNIRHRRIVKHAAATYIFIHGIGDNGDMWQNILAKLPKNTNYLAIDLLGFGDSPMPLWATYDAKAQARSLLATYLKLRIASRVVVVGHSLGSLVAVEFATVDVMESIVVFLFLHSAFVRSIEKLLAIAVKLT